MAFFKFRLPGSKADSRASSTGPVESIEGLRRRARHRLIGAAVLVLVAVIGFPLVFDTQPRPVAVDVAIQIPDRNKVKPLSVASATDAAPGAVAPPPSASIPAQTASAASGPVASAPAQVPARASLDAKEELVAPGSDKKADKPVTKPPEAAVHSEAKASAPTPKPEPKPEPKPPVRPVDDGSRAQALLEGKEATASKPAASDSGRFIVQVGAFADPAKAKETRLKVEKAGLSTYIHVAETPEGKRTRVRVGPFSNRAEAEKAAARIRGLDLPAAILTL